MARGLATTYQATRHVAVTFGKQAPPPRQNDARRRAQSNRRNTPYRTRGECFRPSSKRLSTAPTDGRWAGLCCPLLVYARAGLERRLRGVGFR